MIKKEEIKYKFISLLIVIYLEYINKKDNNIHYNEKTTKIYCNIQKLLLNSSHYKDKEGLGLWRIFLLLDICLFSKQEVREKNIQTISNFYKNLNEDYNEVEILAYEIILSNCQSKNFLDNIIKEGNSISIFNLIKIILKFPNIMSKSTDSILKIFQYIYEISQKILKSSNIKKILVQLLGVLISYILKQGNKYEGGDVPNTQLKKYN